jgi:catechol 2,3-dioxygenase-like lactoylglutathione lyase family enzyme
MTHVAVRTTDIDGSVAFYQRYAGLHIVHDRQDNKTRVVWLSHREQDPDFVIVVLAMPHEPFLEPSATDHFGFAVSSREDVDRIAELARAEGTLKWGPTDAGPIVG